MFEILTMFGILACGVASIPNRQKLLLHGRRANEAPSVDIYLKGSHSSFFSPMIAFTLSTKTFFLDKPNKIPHMLANIPNMVATIDVSTDTCRSNHAAAIKNPKNAMTIRQMHVPQITVSAW